ncbi:ABC transporter substrate-binding protein [Roseomonas xinghualingensis]|uniref:ABC transporter substrate-binding protein n=1 Tax=Roseomonas xinghualingensis TaxID=2986475 RepID=UPI0021F23721|nr:ABC transporter substrate-binding protein [Roseomonas sp. SXEYE001]MCV4208422.1 ABC transporter substrate-binding protein [Roseomonas sp. SXEYE001]
MNRRQLLGAALPLLAAPRLLRAQSAGGPIQITDVAGRKVTLPRQPKRIALTQARHILAMGLLHPDPVSLITGWGYDLRQMNPPDYATVRARFPQADSIPVIVHDQADGLSLETLIAGQPDVLILGRGGARAQNEEVAERVAALGIPTVVIDFFIDPMSNTQRSMAILGQILGREDRAAAFDAFYMEKRNVIARRLEGLGDARPKVMLHAHAGGTPCCSSPGRGAYDSMITFAGGHNIGADVLPGAVGQLALEYLVTQDPKIYVATGGPFGERGGIPLGRGVQKEKAERALVDVIKRTRLDILSCVKAGRAHAIWHGFNDTPAHIIMLEALARWFHPDRCGDLDPAATMAALNSQFLAIPMEGAHWADLPPGTAF